MTTLKTSIVGIKKGRAVVLGKEATNGTLVLPTTYWRGTAQVSDMAVVDDIEEDVSSFASQLRGNISSNGTEIALDPTPATFEGLPILLDSGVKKVTPAADGGGSGYISAYAFHRDINAPNSIGARSAQWGDNQEWEYGKYFFTRELTLTGVEQKPLMMSAIMQGQGGATVNYTASLAFVLATKKITDAANGLAIFTTGMSIRVSGTANNDGIYTVATGGVAGEIVVTEALATESAVTCTIEQVLTASATVPDVEIINFGTGRLYVGEVATAIGSLAQVSNTCMGMEFKAAMCGQSASFTADGSLSFSAIIPVPPELTAKWTLLWNGRATAERVKARAKTVRKFRMSFTGSTFAVAGTTYTNKIVYIDGCGLWDTFKTLDEIDGKDVINATMKIGYNATASLFCTITVVNALAAVL